MTNLFKQNLNQQNECQQYPLQNGFHRQLKQKNQASLSSDANTFFQHQDNFKEKQSQMKEDFQNYWKQRKFGNHAETQNNKSRPDSNIFKFQNSDRERFALQKQCQYGQDLQNTIENKEKTVNQFKENKIKQEKLELQNFYNSYPFERDKFQDRSHQRGHGLANLFSSPQFQTSKQMKLTPVYQPKKDFQFAAEQSLKQFNTNAFNKEPEKKNESVQVSIERITDQFPQQQQPYYLYNNNNQQPIYQNQLMSPQQQQQQQYQMPYSRQNQQLIPQNQFQQSQQQYFQANQNNQAYPQNDNAYQFQQKENSQDNSNNQDNLNSISHLHSQQEKNFDYNHEQKQQLKKLESKLDQIDPQDLSSIEKEIIKTSTYDRHYGQYHDELSIKKLKQMHEFALNRYYHKLDYQKQELEQQQDELIKQYNERMMEEEMARKKQEEEEMLRKQQQESGKQQIINVTPPAQPIEKEPENTSLTDLEKQFMQEQEELRELVSKQMEENSKFLQQKKVELETDHEQKINELKEQKRNLETKESVLEMERKDYFEKMQLLDKEILNLRSNIYQSQNGLIQELGKLKHEAINQHEDRYRNKRHIDNIIEQLKQAEVNDLMREQNLMKAIKETKAFDCSFQPKYMFSKDYEKIIDEKVQKKTGQIQVPTNSKLISLNQKIRNDIYTDATNYQQRQLLPYLDKEYAYSNNLTKAIQLDQNQFPSLKNENEQMKIYNSYQRGLLPIERDERKVYAGKLAKINDDRLYELNKLEKDENQFNVIGKLDDIVYSVQS